MKTLYLIGGPMGVGKTTLCQHLKRRLPGSVFLDGDWCWDSHPFQVTEETKAMVLTNICFLLNQFLRCSAYETVIFCWVLHQQDILDAILSSVRRPDCAVKAISLVCGERELTERLMRDVAAGIRTEGVVERSLSRLPLYEALNTWKVDTAGKTVEQIGEEIIALPENEDFSAPGSPQEKRGNPSEIV